MYYFSRCLFALCLALAIPTLHADALDYPFEKVNASVWVMHGPLEQPNVANRGFMNNPALIVTTAGLVIIDPGSSVQAGEMVLSAIGKITPPLPEKKVVAVFNTHVHGDHWLGNQAIRRAFPDVRIYAHPAMIEAVREGEGERWVTLMEKLTEGATRGTVVVAPDHAINHGETIVIGDTRFRIHHYGQAHTKTDIMIEVVEDKTVFLGDNVLARRIPRMSDGTFNGNIEAVEKILQLDATTWVPGHGPTGNRDMVEAYKVYLERVYAAAKKAFDEDLDSSDVLQFSRPATADYRNWVGYEEELGRHGAQAYAEIEAREF